MRVKSLFAAAAALALASPAAASISTQEELNQAVGAFYGSPTIDSSKAYQLTNYKLEKDIATFLFQSGTLYVGKPIAGSPLTGVFIGEGKASIKPIRKLDKRTLALASTDVLGKSMGASVETSFDRVFMVSLDGTLEKLIASGKEGSAGNAQEASQILESRIHEIQVQERPFDIRLAEQIAGRNDGPLHLEFNTPDFNWLIFEYDPRDTYEVYLGSRWDVGMFHVPRPLIVSHKREDLDPQGEYIADAVKDQKPSIDIRKYEMEITIPNTNHFLVETNVHFSPLVDDLGLVSFDLVNNIAGSSSTDNRKPIVLNKVTDAKGIALPFVHIKNEVLVAPPEPLKIGQDYTFHFSLDEQTIIQLSSVHYLVLNTYPWYPQHGHLGGQAAMDWTIKAKKPLYATGSGKIISEDEDHGYNVTHLVFDQDVIFPSLIFGQYKRETSEYKSKQGGTDVELNVFSWPRATFFLFDESLTTPASIDITVPGGKPKSVLEEAGTIIDFLEQLYGPFPYKQLQVAQMSPNMGFGQAPPGLVQLTGEAFMSSAFLASFGGGNADFFHEFFSHEISHQYWAHAIQWATDEDVWLSESFAEYSSGLYVSGLLGPERFQGKLKEWRDEARIADPHAPIAWANNVSGENAGSWRTGLIYNKGPYVVHMLRMQIGHENFVKAMKNAIEKYRFQQITTDMLRREIEEVVGYKLDYFFDQWYRDTGIPTFDYSTDVRKTEDGKWLATVKISQRDKDNPKIVLMPITFHFGKDKVVTQNRPILGAEDVYQVKLPAKPERITLDEYNTLLADIVAQGEAAGQ